MTEYCFYSVMEYNNTVLHTYMQIGIVLTVMVSCLFHHVLTQY